MTPFERLSTRGQMARLRRLAENALPAWGLSLDTVRLTSLRHAENTTFQVDNTATGERYCLRVQRPGYQTPETTRSEMDWLAALRRDTDLHVPEPVPTTGGDFLQEGTTAPGIPVPRNAVLLKWVYGRFLRQRVPPSTLYRVGALMGHLHEHGTTFSLPPNFVRPRLDDAVFLGRTVEESLAELAPHLTPGDADEMRAAYARVQAAQATLGRGKDAYGLIHGDLHRSNFVIGPGGEVRPIDFDDCGFGHFLSDLVVTYVTIPNGPDQEAGRSALFAGYRTIRPLPEDWLKDCLLPLLWGRQFLVLRWFATRTDHPALYARLPGFTASTVAAARTLLADE